MGINLRDSIVRTTEQRLSALQSELGLTKKGARKVLTIVQMGLKVLLEHGFAALTKRRIAARLDISHGNVGYYFPTRESLWRAVINFELREYHFTYSTYDSDLTDPQKRFDEYILNWIDEYNDRTVRIFFSHMIAYAEVNNFVANIRDEVYEDYLSTAITRARALELDTSEEELERRVLMVIVMLEGLHAVSAFRPNTTQSGGIFRDDLLKLANQIVKGT